MTEEDKKEVPDIELDNAPEPDPVPEPAPDTVPGPAPEPITPRRGPDLSLAAHRKRLGLK